MVILIHFLNLPSSGRNIHIVADAPKSSRICFLRYSGTPLRSPRPYPPLSKHNQVGSRAYHVPTRLIFNSHPSSSYHRSLYLTTTNNGAPMHCRRPRRLLRISPSCPNLSTLHKPSRTAQNPRKSLRRILLHKTNPRATARRRRFRRIRTRRRASGRTRLLATHQRSHRKRRALP